MSSESYHEPLDLLSERTRELHRGIVSLVEELEAIDWYQQRAEASADAELKRVLDHHRVEEIEHAMMNLEWIRRMSSDFDEKMRTYLFSEGPITEVEAREEAAALAAGTAPSARPPSPPPGSGEAAPRGRTDGSLGIGSLRG